ncbi:MAG: HK97 family phage prohead protease [Streptosporangiales bacterium]
MSRKDKLRDAPERRSLALSDFEIRASGDALSLDGYASVFNHDYDVMGGPPWGWTESVDRRAFDDTLKSNPDLHLLINHEGMPLARTKSGTLQLSVDGKGLRVQAPNLDRRDPDVQRLEVKMARGDMDEMSFAFRVKGDRWSDDESKRTLTEVSLHKGDVSVVNFGSNDGTSAHMRDLGSLLEYLDETELDVVGAELRGDADTLARITRSRDKLSALYRTLAPRRGHALSIADARGVVEDLLDLDGARRTALPPHHTSTVDTSWDGPAAVARLNDGDESAFRKTFAWYDSSADDEDGDGYPDAKSAWKFPHHEVSENGQPGAANLHGVRNALARLSQAKIPDSDRAAVQKHLQAHLDSAGD